MFPLFIKLTGRGELVLMRFVLEVLEGEFKWTKGSSGIFKARSISLEDQAFSFLLRQIQNEHSIEYLPSSFIVLMMVRFLRPKLLKEHKTDLEQYHPAPTSPGNRCTLQPLFSITLFSGMYLWSNGLVVKALDSQSRGPMSKTTGLLQDRLSLSSFWGQ